ncbi:unnamed protein product [Moneuplotes crassus]|uniref:Uncharacterized protein n=1 Tax=Euplotes crassus TaxID=5936 RepID=A0AAD1Y657_EUPCR|nr:unnamed protein product [Moneuplotes crassus]
MDDVQFLFQEVRESYKVLSNPYSSISSQDLGNTRLVLFQRFKKRKNRTKNSKMNQGITKENTIRPLSISKLLPESDYKTGNYTGNASHKPGDSREKSPRQKRLALQGDPQRSSFIRGNTIPTKEFLNHPLKPPPDQKEVSISEVYSDSELEHIEEEPQADFDDISEKYKFRKRSQTNLRFEFSPRIDAIKDNFTIQASPIPKPPDFKTPKKLKEPNPTEKPETLNPMLQITSNPPHKNTTKPITNTQLVIPQIQHKTIQKPMKISSSISSIHSKIKNKASSPQKVTKAVQKKDII